MSVCKSRQIEIKSLVVNISIFLAHFQVSFFIIILSSIRVNSSHCGGLSALPCKGFISWERRGGEIVSYIGCTATNKRAKQLHTEWFLELSDAFPPPGVVAYCKGGSPCSHELFNV